MAARPVPLVTLTILRIVSTNSTVLFGVLTKHRTVHRFPQWNGLVYDGFLRRDHPSLDFSSKNNDLLRNDLDDVGGGPGVSLAVDAEEGMAPSYPLFDEIHCSCPALSLKTRTRERCRPTALLGRMAFPDARRGRD